MKAVLVRYSYAPYGTYGIMVAGDHQFHTVEQPWRLNARQRSCVPEGTYQLINHNSAKYPNTFALVNHALNVYYQPGAGVPDSARKAILIHPANVPEDLAGCIGLGTDIGYLRDRLAVVNSKAALNTFRTWYASSSSQKSLNIVSFSPSMSVDDIVSYAQTLSNS